MNIKEIIEFLKVCRELKLKTAGDVEDYVSENRKAGNKINKVFDRCFCIGG